MIYKYRHLITWIPIIGIITGHLYGMEAESPVQKYTDINGAMHGMAVSCAIAIILIKIFLG